MWWWWGGGVNVANISLPQWSERAQTYLLYPSLWCLGESSAYQCYCTTLNSLFSLWKQGWARFYSHPRLSLLLFPIQKYRCFCQPHAFITTYRAEAGVEPYFFWLISMVRSISISFPGQNRRSDKSRVIMVVSSQSRCWDTDAMQV